VESLTRGLPPPDPHSVYLVSSTEVVEPPPTPQNPGYATAPVYALQVMHKVQEMLLDVMSEHSEHVS
jgi:hypothetical protein